MPTLVTMDDATATKGGRSEAHDQHSVWSGVVDKTNASVVPFAKRLLRVLVIDDDRDAADSLSRLVRDWGHEVCWAYDAGTGLEVAAANHPDLVLLDVAMPQGDGCELARHLRGDARLKECFLIAVTGFRDEDHRQRCRQAGIDLVLIKPIDPLILESLLILEREYLRAITPNQPPPSIHASR